MSSTQLENVFYGEKNIVLGQKAWLLGFLQAIVKVGFEATGWSRTLEEAFMIPYEQMSKLRPTK